MELTLVKGADLSCKHTLKQLNVCLYYIKILLPCSPVLKYVLILICMEDLIENRLRQARINGFVLNFSGITYFIHVNTKIFEMSLV